VGGAFTWNVPPALATVGVVTVSVAVYDDDPPIHNTARTRVEFTKVSEPTGSDRWRFPP